MVSRVELRVATDGGGVLPVYASDFIQHIDNAIEAANKPPDLKPAVDTNKAGTTITDPEAVTNPQKIIQAAYQYVQTQGDSAKDALKKLLKGVFKDPEIKSNQLVDLILKHPDAPHEPLNVIQGHDGSKSIAFDDYRDNIILEMEKRIYNNISVEFKNDANTSYLGVEPGAFRKTDYSLDE